MEKNKRNKIIAVVAVVVIILGGIAGYIYWSISSSRIYVEDSLISADAVSLAPSVGGILQEVFVNVGDIVQTSAPIARVGNELIKAKSNGQILSINTNIGAFYDNKTSVSTMINPEDLRVVGQVQEDKGLKFIKVGQTTIFTVDAFGSKEYSGVVDEISPTLDEKWNVG